MPELLTEEELSHLLNENEVVLNLARTQTNEYRKKFTEAETRLIAAKEVKTDLVERLRRIRLSNPKNVAATFREIDIERFKIALPVILSKLNKE